MQFCVISWTTQFDKLQMNNALQIIIFSFYFPYVNIKDWMHVIKGDMHHPEMVSMWFYVIQPKKIKVYFFHFKFNVTI